MNIPEAESKIKELMGIYVPGWEFRWDKATVRAGCCHEKLKRITMSKKITELNSWEFVEDIILHEIAHALVGVKCKHGKVWKAKCVELGCRPERYCSPEVVRPKMKYKAICPNCGYVWYRNRKANGCCCRCLRKYDPRFELEWVEAE